MQSMVLDRLRFGLMSGVFVPGQTLSLRSLAAALGTSPMPVRESLSRLVAARALEEVSNRTIRVPRLTLTGLIELFELRTHVEGMAARIACERANAALIDRLTELNDRILTAHAEQNMDRVLVENRHFHFAIYESANSDILMPVIESLWLRCGPTMYHSFSSPKSLWDTSCHLRLLDAFVAGDAQAARLAMVNDIMKTGDFLIAEAKRTRQSGPLAELLPLSAAWDGNL